MTVGATDTEPEVDVSDVHGAEHDEALVADQESVLDCPAVRDVGVAVRERVGADGGGGTLLLTVTFSVMVVLLFSLSQATSFKV